MVVHHFLGLVCSIPLCDYTSIYLSILLLVGVWVVSSPDKCLELVNETVSEAFSEKRVALMEPLVLE